MLVDENNINLKDDPALVAQLRVDLSARFNELATLQRMVLALEADLAAAKVEVQHAIRSRTLIEKQLKKMQQSKSWRSTGFLRAICRSITSHV